MSHGPYQKKYLVSSADMERLVEQYKGTLMENSRLTHAARLAAKQHVLLASPEIPPATKKIRVKALGPAVRRATKRVRVMSLHDGLLLGENLPDALLRSRDDATN